MPASPPPPPLQRYRGTGSAPHTPGPCTCPLPHRGPAVLQGQDLENYLSCPPPWLLLVHWVLVYKRDLHVYVATSVDPLPVYYQDLVASLGPSGGPETNGIVCGGEGGVGCRSAPVSSGPSDKTLTRLRPSSGGVLACWAHAGHLFLTIPHLCLFLTHLTKQSGEPSRRV